MPIAGLFLSCLFASGCLPFATTGHRWMSGWDSMCAGFTAPISLTRPSRRPSGEASRTFLDLSVSTDIDELELWLWRDEPTFSSTPSMFGFTEISIGVGRGAYAYLGAAAPSDEWLDRHIKGAMWGWSAGLIYIRTSLDDPYGTDGDTLGVYAAAGFQTGAAGGFVARLTLALDVEMAGADWGVSGVTLSYWWSLGSTGGVGAAHVAPVLAIIGLAYAGQMGGMGGP